MQLATSPLSTLVVLALISVTAGAPACSHTHSDEFNGVDFVCLAVDNGALGQVNDDLNFAPEIIANSLGQGNTTSVNASASTTINTTVKREPEFDITVLIGGIEDSAVGQVKSKLGLAEGIVANALGQGSNVSDSCIIPYPFPERWAERIVANALGQESNISESCIIPYPVPERLASL